MTFFKKNKDQKIRKISETLEKSNNGDTKLFTAGHLKTVFKIFKPIKQ